MFNVFICGLQKGDTILKNFSFVIPLGGGCAQHVFGLKLPITALGALFTFIGVFLSHATSRRKKRVKLVTFAANKRVRTVA